MNLLRNSLLMRKTGDRRRTELTEIFAFLCGFPAEFITRSKRRPGRGGKGDDATGTRLAVVASGGVSERCAGNPVALYSPECVEG